MENYDEIRKNAVLALKAINPQLPYGTELFNEIARVTVGTAIEAVILRKKFGCTEVFLTKRPDGEAYGGLWHCPGTFLRPGEDEADAFKRLEDKEKVGKFTNKRFIGYKNTPNEERGHIIQLIFLCDIEPVAGNVGTWYPVDNLPTNIVDNHRVILIPKAVAAIL